VTDLAEIAAGVVERAQPGEALEAYVAFGSETEVRAYQGEVESLTSATTSGVGVRVLLETPDGARVGFASAGSLDEGVVEKVLADARDNAQFGSPDPAVVLAVPDGVVPAELVLEDPSLGAVPTDRKIALAIELERAARAADPRVRQIDEASYGDAVVESALASTTGIRSRARRSISWLALAAIADGTGRDQTGYGSLASRGVDGLDVEQVAKDAVVRATRLLGSSKPASTRCAVVFDPRVTATLTELEKAGVPQRPEVIVADAGYWNEQHMDEIVANKHLQVLVAPDKSSRRTPRKTWTGGRYDWMRAVLRSEAGAERYRKRRQTVEPVFGNTKHNKRVTRFLRRGRVKARTEWRLHMMTIAVGTGLRL